jgi:2-polyprenyl-3-methyl-5-hydroxy-6-metoxy-1,4-benzoquinol methylase
MSLPAGLPGKVASCGLCGSWNLAPVLDMGEQPLPERYGPGERSPLALLECRACTLVQLSYIAAPAEVFAPDHSYSTGNTKALREHFASLAAVLAGGLAADDLVVDLGANDGTLLEAVRLHAPGARLLGVEPTGQAARMAAKGIEVCQEFFTHAVAKRLRQMYGPAKIVTANNVLAHVPDPHSFMAGVMRLLADGGVFVTENHDVNAVLDGLQIDTVYHEHARYWSVSTLSRLLGAHGLVVTDVEKIPVHGGSFRVYARRQKTRDLSWRAKAAAKALRVMLDGFAQQGPVYGIGATTRATPLIHFAGIADYLACVCEVPGSAKIGLTMPGTSIPVVDEAKLIADQPPAALLLSWHLASDIVPALRAKGYQGVFIAPLPEPTVLHG